MAPLPDHNTARLWVDYTNSYDVHTILWRYNDLTADVEDAKSAVTAFLTALSTSINAINLISMRYAVSGSDVSLPTGLPEDTSYGSGALNAGARANSWQFLGRSSTGRRGSFYLYAVAAAVPVGARVPISSDSNLAAAIATLITATDTGAWVAIDANAMFVKPYVNFVVNDYWTHQIRA